MNFRRFSCLTAVAGAVVLAPAVLSDAEALPVKYLNVQPIQVCDDGGANCANTALQLFLAETDKIWAQADIDVVFLPWMQVNSSAQLNEDNFDQLGLNANPDVVNMWFIESLASCGGESGPFYGCGSPSGRVAITDDVFTFNAGVGRLDTIAHELGHVLALDHGTFGAGGPDNLMTAGGARSVPGSINDIFPDGADLDKLTAEQITAARQSGAFLLDIALAAIPEPATTALLLAGLAGLVLARKRRAA
jgi:hypothetical protein